MSKPLKLLYVTFDKNSTFSAGGGCGARDYSPMFVSEKCDIFIMQATRMFNSGSSTNAIGTLTRKFDQGSRVVANNGNPVKSYGWFPPYFYEAFQQQTTAGPLLNWMCDKFSVSPSFPFSIVNSNWFVPSVQPAGLPSSTFTGMHVTSFNSTSGLNIIIGSYCQLGTANTNDQIIGLRECINEILNFSGINPFILCCNLNINNSTVASTFSSSNGATICQITSLTTPILTGVAPSGVAPLYSTTLSSGYYIITKGLSIDVDLLPMAPTTSPDIESPAGVEFPPLLITLNNFIIQNKNTTSYANTISKYVGVGGSLVNNLLL